MGRETLPPQLLSAMDLTSGFPFWPLHDGLLHAYPSLETDLTCDAAVIGGGITGALVAYHLVEAGVDTVVLDKRDVGWGSTAGSTALLQYEIDVSLVDLGEKLGVDHATRAYLACRDAIHKLEQVAGRLSGDTGFSRKRSLYLATRKRDRKALVAEFGARRSIGIDLDWLDEPDVASRFSFRRPAALLSRDAAQVDPYAFAHALLHDATARGARVFDRTTVKAVDVSGISPVLRTTDGRTIRARRVVFAAGYETTPFLRRDIGKLVSTYALASEPLSSFAGWGEDQCLIWEHAHPYLYFRTTDDGRVIMGGEDERFRNPARRDRHVQKKSERLARRFHELFPDIPMRVAFSWAGTFGETSDGLAYIGQLPEWPNAYFALGYGGNGITFSILAAEIIRDAMLGRPNEHARLFAFDRRG